MEAVTPDVAADAGLDVTSGVLIQEVTSDSPAARAGLRQGDVITAADGRAIEDAEGLAAFIKASSPATG